MEQSAMALGMEAASMYMGSVKGLEAVRQLTTEEKLRVDDRLGAFLFLAAQDKEEVSQSNVWISVVEQATEMVRSLWAL